jgi:hypothetical protein
MLLNSTTVNPNLQIRKLILRGNVIDDEGKYKFGDFIKNLAKLEYLDISSCVHDENTSLKHLLGTCANFIPSIKQLLFADNTSTGAVPNLNKVVNLMPNLVYFDISNLTFTKDEIEKIIDNLKSRMSNKKDWNIPCKLEHISWVKGIEES